MWTVANLIDRLSGDFEFAVFTRDRDHGDRKRYPRIEAGEWHRLAGGESVYYASPGEISPSVARRIVDEAAPDVVFLNSVFGAAGIAYLRARRRNGTRTPTVVAPCGELSAGAMRSSALKKRLFLLYAKAVGLYRDVIWKATTELESEEIKSVFGRHVAPQIAPDLTPKEILPGYSADLKPQKRPGEARFIFFSRVVPKKNLAYFLEALSQVRPDSNVHLTVAGPLEDAAYWAECRTAAGRLGANVSLEVAGGVERLEGLRLLCENHFFVLPTLNENFGYVILESLAAGTPAILSENTIWGGVEAAGAGWILPLACRQDWTKLIEYCVAMEADEFRRRSTAARTFALNYLAENSSEDLTRRLFTQAAAL
ncbi:MAG: glycosyltransferase [Pyrinomonadaceae bacterium]